MPSSKVAPAPPPPAKPGRAPPPPPRRPPPLQAAGVGELDEEDEDELDEDDEDDDDDDDDDDDNDDDDSDGEEKEGGEDFEDDSRASGGSGDSSSLSSEDSQYYREDEGTYVRPNIRATVRKMTEVELARIKEPYRSDVAGKEIERWEVKAAKMPPFTKVTNRVDVVFEGATPVVDTPDLPRMPSHGQPEEEK